MKFFLVLLLLAIATGWTVPTAVEVEPLIVPKHIPIDPRVGKLEAFFIKYKCPEPTYVKEYLEEADEHQVDWRLLPAISVAESSCGRHYRSNNYWGWNSAKTGFGSVREGIGFVTEQLATSRYYRGKTPAQILRTYGPGTNEYVQRGLFLMKQIDN